MSSKTLLLAFLVLSVLNQQQADSVVLNRAQLLSWYPNIATQRHAKLARKQITSVEPDTFTGLTNLTKINLERNLLAFLSPATFTGLINLKEIELSSNQLSSLDYTPRSQQANFH